MVIFMKSRRSFALLIIFLITAFLLFMMVVVYTGSVHAEQFSVKSETIRIVTAYNVGDPNQCDDTPCISANNENICDALDAGEMRCAANFVPLGTRLYVANVGICLVTDRTNRRYRHRVDIAMKKHEKQKALRFGRQKLNVKILN